MVEVVVLAVVAVAVVVVVVISSCRWNHTSENISKFILKRTSSIYVDGKDTSPTSWMRRLICVFTESILLYGVCCALAKPCFNIKSDHHTQVHTRTRWHHSVNRCPGYRKYPKYRFSQNNCTNWIWPCNYHKSLILLCRYPKISI